eukprot:10572737-Ditylum_brightwellii.AAC.1
MDDLESQEKASIDVEGKSCALDVGESNPSIAFFASCLSATLDKQQPIANKCRLCQVQSHSTKYI